MRYQIWYYTVTVPILERRKGQEMQQRINEKLGAWLLVDGNTREKLANALGISRQSLNKRINGTAQWYWNEVVKVAQLTGCTLDDLADLTY